MAARTRTVQRGFVKPLFLALSAALLLALPSSVLAAGWSSFSSVPTSGATIASMKFAADPAGNQIAVWVEQPSPFKVMAAFRPVGGVWGAAQTLDNTATTAPRTDVAVDDAGNFIVLYSEVIGTTSKVFSSYRAAGQSSFGAPQQFGSTLVGAVILTGLGVAVNRTTGTAYAVHGIQGAGGVAGVRAAGAGSAWTLAPTGLPTDSAIGLDLTVGTDGVPTLADYPSAGGQLRHSRFNTVTSTWTTITTPTGVSNATGQLIVKPDAGGRTTTLFQGASTFTQLFSQSCAPGTAAATACTARAQFQLTPNTSTVNPSLSVDAAGNAVASWNEGTAVAFSRRPGPTGTWSAPANLGSGGAPSVQFDSGGNLMTAFAETQSKVKYLLAAPGSAPTAPAADATDPAQTWNLPTLAADTAGNTYGAWMSSAAQAIQTAVYDVEAPAAPALTAPAAAVARDAATYAAISSDKWSAVSYSWDFGDGATGAGSPVTHAYAAAGTYTARVTATDSAGNASSQTQTVTVTPAARAPLSRPIAGQTVNLEPAGGEVLVRPPGASSFTPLTSPTQVRDGVIIDARNGRVRITIDNGRGGLDTAEFYGGVFKFTQPKVKPGQRWFANLYLYGGSFKGCPRAPRNPKIASLAAAKKKRAAQGKSVRRLWGSGEGAFRTVGRFSSATIRGTTWLTDDRCKGTLTKVTVGKVGVRDFALQKTVVLRKGKSYFAAPKPAKKSSRTAKR